MKPSLVELLSEAAKGLVTPAVTLLFAGAIIWGWFHGRLSDDAFLGVAGPFIAFWISGRQIAAATSAATTAAKSNGAPTPTPPPVAS